MSRHMRLSGGLVWCLRLMAACPVRNGKCLGCGEEV